jgi:SAM-dependent methyltransferase
MMFLWRMLARRGGGSMDPLQVSMTGVRMGESFLLVGCRDKALLAGLAAKVGLSGSAAVAAFDRQQTALAEKIGAQVGALIEIKDASGHWPFDDEAFDMVVVDDTDGAFWTHPDPNAILENGRRSLRRGGRIEVVTPVSAHEEADFIARLSAVGFKPVRLLAERNGLRFVEGLRASDPSS